MCSIHHAKASNSFSLSEVGSDRQTDKRFHVVFKVLSILGDRQHTLLTICYPSGLFKLNPPVAVPGARACSTSLHARRTVNKSSVCRYLLLPYLMLSERADSYRTCLLSITDQARPDKSTYFTLHSFLIRTTR